MGNTGVINSSGMALGRDGISCGSSHASILEQFGAVQVRGLWWCFGRSVT